MKTIVILATITFVLFPKPQPPKACPKGYVLYKNVCIKKDA